MNNMTQENILVSPTLSACLKSGDSVSPRFRPSDLGDTRRHVAHVSRPARLTSAPSYPQVVAALGPIGQSLLCAFVACRESDTSLNSSDLCEALFLRKYLIFSLF